MIYHWLRGHDTHPTKLRIEAYQTRNISLIVLKCVDVAFAGLLDEIPIKNLPTVLLVLERLGTNLDSVAEPICDNAC
jgi:hypothetical protein